VVVRVVVRELLTKLTQLRFCLLQPIRDAHFAVHRRRDGEVLLSRLAMSRPPVELAEAEVAVGYERAHVEL